MKRNKLMEGAAVPSKSSKVAARRALSDSTAKLLQSLFFELTLAAIEVTVLWKTGRVPCVSSNSIIVFLCKGKLWFNEEAVAHHLALCPWHSLCPGSFYRFCSFRVLFIAENPRLLLFGFTKGCSAAVAILCLCLLSDLHRQLQSSLCNLC